MKKKLAMRILSALLAANMAFFGVCDYPVFAQDLSSHSEVIASEMSEDEESDEENLSSETSDEKDSKETKVSELSKRTMSDNASEKVLEDYEIESDDVDELGEDSDLTFNLSEKKWYLYPNEVKTLYAVYNESDKTIEFQSNPKFTYVSSYLFNVPNSDDSTPLGNVNTYLKGIMQEVQHIKWSEDNKPCYFTKINTGAFAGCTALLDVDLSKAGFDKDGKPSGITEIQGKAFDGCKSLSSVNLGSNLVRMTGGVYGGCFAGCVSLTKITLPESLTHMEKGEFLGCKNLTTVIVETSSFGSECSLTTTDGIFSGCKLQEIVFKEGLTGIPNGLFAKATFDTDKAEYSQVKIPKTIEQIGVGTFSASNITKVTFEEGSKVAGIGEKAFFKCSNLSSFEFVDSIQEIGESAFEGCVFTSIDMASVYKNTELKKIGNKAFKDNLNLLTLKLPSSVVTVGSSVFEGCTSLKDSGSDGLDIPMKVIGDSMFKNCSSIEKVNFSSAVEEIGQSAFENCTSLKGVHITAAINKIGMKAFMSCAKIEKLTFDKDSVLEAIPDNCFACSIKMSGKDIIYDTSLRSGGAYEKIVLPSKLTTIGAGAFSNCNKILAIDFPDSLVEIKQSAFAGCDLKEIILPKNLKKVGNSAFQCINLGYIRIQSSELEAFGTSPFGGVVSTLIFDETVEVIPKNFMNDVTFVANTKITIPKSVKVIGDQAFGVASTKTQSTSFSEIEFEEGSNLESIGALSFANNAQLKSVDLPISLKTIGNNAFDGCKSLVGCTIPENVTKIGFNAFSRCDSLGDIHYNAISATIGTGTPKEEQAVFYQSTIGNAYLGPKVRTLPAALLRGALYKDDESGNVEKYTLVCPSTMEELPDYALINFKNVDKIIIANENLSKIGDFAFESCEGLEQVIVNSSAIYDEKAQGYKIDESKNYVGLPKNLTQIGNSAFSGCVNLDNVKIPNTVTSIGTSAFKNCKKLSEIEIPENLTQIEDNTFYGCLNLVKVVFNGNNVKSIGQCAFQESGIEGILDIPGGVTEIKDSAFADCSALKEVDFPSTLNTIADTILSGCNVTKLYAAEGTKAYEWILKNYPNLIEKKYKITYVGILATDKNNNDASYREGEEMKFATPSRDGYQFLGWFKDEALNIKIESTKGCTGDLVVYAGWKAIEYNITYILNGGVNDPANPLKVGYGTALTLKDPTRLGSSFDGWYTDEGLKNKWKNGTVIKEDITVYAKWKEFNYRITYNFNGGIAVKGIVATVSCTGSSPITLYGEGCCTNGKKALVGWNTKNDGSGTHYECGQILTTPLATKPNETVTLYAEWETDTYAIQYVLKKNVSVSDNVLTTGNKSYAAVGREKKLLEAIYVSYPGYELTGWSTKKNGKGETFEPGQMVKDLASSGKTIKLYPIFEMRTYKVTYMLNDDDLDPATLPNKIKYEYTAKKPAKFKKAKRPGYKFAGWYLNYDAKTGKGTTKITSSKKQGGDLIVYAVWTPIKYSVVYNKNGGTLTADGKKAFKGTKGIKYTDDYTLLTPTDALVTNDGYTFNGWNTKKDGSGTSYTAGQVVNRLSKKNKKLKLYAQWK